MRGKKVKKLRKKFVADGGGTKAHWRKYKKANL
jgi:hypothetical protein